jgi:glycosyltransferase involved in cell wall biosynthesis
MKEQYHWADLYVLPSANEPAAVSILEAMSFGLPVICSDQNGTKCYVVEGGNGFVFRSGDVQSLSSILETLLSDRRRLLKMGKRSTELVKERHAPDKVYQAFTDLVS